MPAPTPAARVSFRAEVTFEKSLEGWAGRSAVRVGPEAFRTERMGIQGGEACQGVDAARISPSRQGALEGRASQTWAQRGWRVVWGNVRSWSLGSWG